ncbi:MAG: adenylosuccinate synthase [Bacteroidota bacterium]|nr:adenylosuccinate synthase [Bacteroidota bacterium]
MAVDVLIGLQWGDEGKGKIVDYLAPRYSMIARFQGGPNAGHTLKIDGQKFVLHTVPSGIFNEGMLNLIGNGVVIDPITLNAELSKLNALGIALDKSLFIARKAHLILPTHRMLDAASESAKGAGKIGSTLKGIGPTYMDKTGRNGLRIGDLEHPDFKKQYQILKEKHLRLLEQYQFDYNLDEIETEWFNCIELIRKQNLVNGEYFINSILQRGEHVLAEGAQGSMLDIDFGTYPFVTSSNTMAAAACTGLGVAPTKIRDVYGISKAYCTRVGSGPFPTELFDDTGERIRKEGAEFGATTGRPRRCGWLDLPALNYTIMLSGTNRLIITKADVLSIFDQIQVCNAYNINGVSVTEMPYDLCTTGVTPEYESVKGWAGTTLNVNEIPDALISYLKYIENKTGVKISLLSIGPEREQLIELENLKIFS